MCATSGDQHLNVFCYALKSGRPLVKSNQLNKEAPHRRFNPLTGEWVLVSPHRSKRPWQGRTEDEITSGRPAYDPNCFLCPTNTRTSGETNPDYKGPLIFENDFPALLQSPAKGVSQDPMFQAENVRGKALVLCFSERHDLTLPELSLSEVRAVVDAWADQTAQLGKQWQWVAIFENKGELMGCSQPHPHAQIWASDFVPNEVTTEDERQKAWLSETGRVLLVDYASQEAVRDERLVMENTDWIVVVPWWATWPFETLLLPRRHVLRLQDLSDGERDSLADILKRLTISYDNLFQTEFPYTMGWHGAPTRPGNHSHWQLHAHFYPPLLRSATIRKFMVGYEMLSEAQRDLTPESAAERLRGLPSVHYKSKSAGGT